MSEFKKQLAKGNLIKSLSISGGITAVVTVTGLAISIPVYNNIKKQLGQVASQVADLSKFMHDLTAKLGIPPNQTFEKELAGGYTLLYSNGKTKIFAGTGNQKSLVMNMNDDGTVGSAAQLQGPAAQKMLGIISEAKATIGSEVDTMNDIMKDYVDQTIDSSLATEAAVTGISKNALIARNTLSAKKNLTQAQKDDLLRKAAQKSGISLNALKAEEQNAQQLIVERNQRIQEAIQAWKSGTSALIELRKQRAQAIKETAIAYLNYNNHKLINVIFNNQVYANIADQGNEEALSDYYHKMQIEDSQVAIAAAKRKIATDWLDANNISYQNVTFKDTVADGINAQPIAYNDLSDGNHDITLQNFYTYQVTLNALAKKQDHQIQSVDTSGKGSSILQKVAKSITSWPSMYVKAKYGYTRPNGTVVSPSSNLLKGLKSVLFQQGVSVNSYNQMTDMFDQIIKVQNGNPTKTFELTNILNTYNIANSNKSRLVVLQVDIKDINNSSQHETKYLVARTSTKIVTNLEKLYLSKNINEAKTIYSLAQSACIKFSDAITKKSIFALMALIENNKFPTNVFVGNDVFNELAKANSIIKTLDDKPGQKSYISQILFTLLQKYLFEGKDINNFKSSKFISAAKTVMKVDDFKGNSLNNPKNQNAQDLYLSSSRPWMKTLYNFITSEKFNYDNFDTFVQNIHYFTDLDKDLRDSINKNYIAISAAFRIILDENVPRISENQINLELNRIGKYLKS